MERSYTQHEETTCKNPDFQDITIKSHKSLDSFVRALILELQSSLHNTLGTERAIKSYPKWESFGTNTHKKEERSLQETMKNWRTFFTDLITPLHYCFPGSRICFSLHAPSNDPITQRTPPLAPGFHSFFESGLLCFSFLPCNILRADRTFPNSSRSSCK